MGFSRQESWSGLPFLSPGDLPDPGIEPGSPALQADALPSEPPGKPNSIYLYTYFQIYIYISISYFLVILCMLCPKSSQSCLTPYDPIDRSPPGSSVYGIHQTSGLPWASSGDLPDPGIEPMPLTSAAMTGRFFIASTTGKTQTSCSSIYLVYLDLTFLLLFVKSI